MSGEVDRFDLRRPCPGCPFLKVGDQAVRALRPNRIRQIARDSAPPDGQGATFACHRTVEATGGPKGGKVQHCIGALLYGTKLGTYSNGARLAGRLGLWNPDNLEGLDEVWDSEEDWLEHAGD